MGVPTVPTVPTFGRKGRSAPAAGGGGFPAVLTLLDDFERASEAPIGAPWSGTAAGGTASLKVVTDSYAQEEGGNAITGRAWPYNASAEPGTDIALLPGPYGPDVQLWGQIASGGDTFDQYTFAVRVENAGSAAWTGYMLRLNRGINWQIVKRLAGPTETTLATVAWGVPGLDDFDAFGFEVIGSSLKGYHRVGSGGSWAEFISASDGDLSSAGAIGARILLNDPEVPGDPMIEYLRGGTV